jgi:hypothetical protein
MNNFTVENISITRMSNSSGIFIGKKNTLKKFQHESVITEVIGALSGNANTLKDGYWIKNRETWEED